MKIFNFQFSIFKRGLTLIEVLVTIAVFGLVVAGLTSLILMIYKSQYYTWEQAVAINEARKGIETMTKEIREAREGSDGSYLIEKADDKEFIFYSDIDNDEKTERVRYFLGTVNSGNQTQECQTSASGGACSVLFSGFLSGTLTSATVQVSVDGDMSWNNREYAEIFADSVKLGEVCRTGCSDCPGTWQGAQTYNVASYASDNSVTFLADATSYVGPQCSYAMKARFEFSFSEELAGLAHEFRKGVIEPVGDPPIYPADQETIVVLTPYVRNVPPIFEYYDASGNKITEYPARLVDTKMMKVFLVVNVQPDRLPSDFELESFVQLRNLKDAI
jgi:prepilin-type N-terminal cleavage/methylation domain-containing protein